MPDFDFEPIGPSRSGHSQTALMISAYKPVLPKGTPLDVCAMSLDVRRLFRQRLSQMFAVGYAPLQDTTTYQYVRNCPPFGVETNHHTRCCRHSLFCVYCWGRDAVSPLWNKIKRECLDDKGKPRRDRWVLDFRYRKRLWLKHGKPIDQAIALASSTVDRTFEIHKVKFIGAWVGHFFRPYKEYLDYERRGILVTDGHTWTQSPGKIEFHTTKFVSQKNLVNAVGRVCAFPHEMWTSDVHIMKTLLTCISKSKLRTRAFYGSFRGE